MINKYCAVVPSPIGNLTILGSNEFVYTLTFGEKDLSGLQENEITANAAAEVKAYLDGNLKIFTFPMMQEGTDFQKGVWHNLTKIPFGETISYAKFSAHQPLAIRAIASANGKNNIAIVVPCHRVIGSNGKLVGYAGGLWRKQWLLQHEREVAQSGQTELKF